MLHLLHELLNIRLEGNSFVSILQIFSLIVLVIFLCKSIWKIIAEIKSTQQVHVIFAPLGIVYMILSFLFILIFIGYFDDITKDFIQWFEYSFRQYYSHIDHFLDEERIKDLNRGKQWVSICLPFVLTAFACNFSKAFFTLNSLELGLLFSQKLSDINLNKNQVFWEGFFRLLIAITFIAIEKDLSDMNHGGSFDFRFLFRILSISILVLYLLMLVWYLIIRSSIWQKTEFYWWKFYTPVQFGLGAILAFIYAFFSFLNEGSFSLWKEILILIALIMIALSLAIILIIVFTEFGRSKKVNSDNETEQSEILAEKAEDE